ncbi:MAG: hypothetical protein CBC13_06870 [Planctomycetia bacterium TMED53]|nr:MAG: hypothetical protein CBC13_06870 [Planctomycetia bacterium TMED53]
MRRFFQFAVIFTFMVTFPFSANGQTMHVGNASSTAGSSFSTDFTLDAGGGDAQGWSFGACNPSELTPTNVADGDGAANSTSTVKNGSPADFVEVSLFPEGWTQGVVICFTGCGVIAAGTTGFLMATTTYDVDGAASPADYTIDYCSTLGTPPVSTVVVVGGSSNSPTTSSGTITIQDVPPPTFTYNAPDKNATYSPDDGNASFSAEITVSETDNSALGAPFPNETQGFSMGLAHDSALLEATSVAFSGPVAALDGGNGPGFAETSIYTDGWTAGVVYSFIGAETITFSTGGDTAIIAEYSTVAGALAGDEDGETTTLSWSSGLGSPPVTNVMVVAGNSLAANLNDGTITFEAVSVTPFLRSDANADSRNDVADAIWMLSDLFLGGPTYNCLGANDANADGFYDTADPIHVINYQFLDGSAPSAPFPDCGVAPDQEPEDCLEYPGC